MIVILINQATYQDVNRKSAEGNGVCKDNHDSMGSMKKPIKLLVKSDPEDAKKAQDDGDIYYQKIEMPFNSMMAEFFYASDIIVLI